VAHVQHGELVSTWRELVPVRLRELAGLGGVPGGGGKPTDNVRERPSVLLGAPLEYRAQLHHQHAVAAAAAAAARGRRHRRLAQGSRGGAWLCHPSVVTRGAAVQRLWWRCTAGVQVAHG
jgi:hypothetical protein